MIYYYSEGFNNGQRCNSTSDIHVHNIVFELSVPVDLGLSESKFIYVSHKGFCHTMAEAMFTQDTLSLVLKVPG